MTQEKTNEEIFSLNVNELNYLREEIKTFINNSNLEIRKTDYYIYLGVKKGYTKPLINKGYSRKKIIEYLNLLEYGLNEGLVCFNCLEIGVFSIDNVNAFCSVCPKCKGSLI